MENNYKAFDHFLLRTPSLPFSHAQLLHPDYNNPFFREAIYIASNELYNEMEKYDKGELTDKDKEKIDSSLYKYWKRIRTRTTPYGLFSGISEGQIRNEPTGLWSIII